MVTLYGIKNCDTIKKARKWLEAHDIAYTFHDYRKDGIDRQQLQAWVDELGWEVLLNTRGTTWRKLPDEVRQDMSKEKAITVMLENPSIIKRPVLDLGAERKVGFKEAEYQQYFANGG